MMTGKSLHWRDLPAPVLSLPRKGAIRIARRRAG